MGYLDSTAVTVDAVLTKKGRQIIAQGGSLDIQTFTLSDTGVDYTLWNADHASGSAFYGEAIENLPQVEALTNSQYATRNKLVSLARDTVAMPALEVDGNNNFTTLKNSDGSYTIHFSNDSQKKNQLNIIKGWNYTIRLYEPTKQFFQGIWKFPKLNSL